MSTRSYVATTTAGATTTTVQIQAKGRLRQIVCSKKVDGSAGVLEISLNPSSLIATAQPGLGVLARMAYTGVPFNTTGTFDCDIPVEAFTNIYLHQTGASNSSEVTLCVSDR